jgi:aspartate beta-hydroxylase
VLDPASHFPDAARFAAAWRRLRDEALHVAAELSSVPRFHEVMPEQEAISSNDGRDWRMFILRAYGVDVVPNSARCPTLAALVASAPDVLSASFSFLAPRKHIPAHRGPFRGVLRFYLVLSMPVAADRRPCSASTTSSIGLRMGRCCSGTTPTSMRCGTQATSFGRSSCSTSAAATCRSTWSCCRAA